MKRFFRRPIQNRAFLLALLVLLAASATVAAVLQERIRTAVRWGHGKIEVAHGCSVWSPGIFDDERNFEKAASEIHLLERDGALGMFDTPIGTIWYPMRSWTLPALVEKSESDPYRLRAAVHAGAVVLDIGSNVGTETRAALDAGARLVVAIEPEPLNLQCLRRNLNSEIREKRVIVIPKGAWSKDGVLPLHVDEANAGGSSFVWAHGDKSVGVPVTTVDEIVAKLKLRRVDVIKVHVEGAEEQVLAGAQNTIRRDHPQLALVLEHHIDDVDKLPAAARAIWPGYRVKTTPCTKTFDQIHPDVALLRP
jgi:FkbM family methyltransferase